MPKLNDINPIFETNLKKNILHGQRNKVDNAKKLNIKNFADKKFLS